LSKTNFFFEQGGKENYFHDFFSPLDWIAFWQCKPGILPPPPFWNNSVTLITDFIDGTDTRAEEEETMNDCPFNSLFPSWLFN